MGLVAASLALFLGVLELYLAHRYSVEHARLVGRYAHRELCTRHAADRELIYEFVPNRCGYNSRGFDDDEHTLAKLADVFRILVIGDSVAQGISVDRNARFSSRLRLRLNAHGGDAVEIINLARTGYSTEQELVILDTVGLALNPDLVLWSYVLNDPAHPVFHDANGQLGRYFVDRGWLGLHYIRKKWFDLNERVARSRCGSEFHALLHCAYRPRIAKQIARLGEMTAAHKVPVVFAIHPVFRPGSTFVDYALAAVHEDLEAMATGAELHVVDLTETFIGRSAESLHLDLDPDSFDPWHLNELGHALTAERLANEISGMELR